MFFGRQVSSKALTFTWVGLPLTPYRLMERYGQEGELCTSLKDKVRHENQVRKWIGSITRHSNDSNMRHHPRSLFLIPRLYSVWAKLQYASPPFPTSQITAVEGDQSDSWSRLGYSLPIFVSSSFIEAWTIDYCWPTAFLQHLWLTPPSTKLLRPLLIAFCHHSTYHAPTRSLCHSLVCM